jgi:hypothetical protein
VALTPPITLSLARRYRSTTSSRPTVQKSQISVAALRSGGGRRGGAKSPTPPVTLLSAPPSWRRQRERMRTRLLLSDGGFVSAAGRGRPPAVSPAPDLATPRNRDAIRRSNAASTAARTHAPRDRERPLPRSIARTPNSRRPGRRGSRSASTPTDDRTGTHPGVPMLIRKVADGLPDSQPFHSRARRMPCASA